MKNKINIDWECDDAEGKNYCLYSKSDYSCRFYKTKPIIDSEGLWTYNENYFGAPLADKWALHERPKEKQMDSIYTQEMYEDGELPKIGMKALYSYDEKGESRFLCDVRYVTDSGDVVIYSRTHRDEKIIQNHIETHRLHPIDTRTDKEKAADDFMSLLNELTDDGSIAVTVIMDSIQAGEIHGVTFTENK